MLALCPKRACFTNTRGDPTGKNRLEAFSDGVIAIIVTIMVLESKVPHDSSFRALPPLWPVFMCCVLSFVYVGIYRSNHHHMLHAMEEVSGGVLWASLHLLFSAGLGFAAYASMAVMWLIPDQRIEQNVAEAAREEEAAARRGPG